MLSDLEAVKIRLLPMFPCWRRGEALSIHCSRASLRLCILSAASPAAVPSCARPADANFHRPGLAPGGCSFLLSWLRAVGATSPSYPSPLPHPHPCSAAASCQQHFRQRRDPSPTPPQLPAGLSFQNLFLGRVLC